MPGSTAFAEIAELAPRPFRAAVGPFPVGHVARKECPEPSAIPRCSDHRVRRRKALDRLAHDPIPARRPISAGLAYRFAFSFLSNAQKPAWHPLRGPACDRASPVRTP